MRAARYTIAGAVLALALGAAPQAAAAQDSGWWQWALGELVRSGGGQALPRPDARTRYPTNDRYDPYEREARTRKAKKGGPKFCQNGAGHPVHGRQWCRDKGFGGGQGIYWEDRGWEDIVLRGPRDRDRRGGILDRGGLADVLGGVIFGRLDGERRRLGGERPLTGRWVSPAGSARVLQIRSGTLPVAELTDLDGDGRIDRILVPRR